MQKEVKGTALITGASSGIGLELARLFAKDGIHVVLVARSTEKLQRLATELEDAHSIRAKILPFDLADAGAPDHLFMRTQEESIPVDFLVNNAGFGMRESFEKNDLKQILEMLQVNIVALTHLTKLYVKEMLARKSGKILNVGSTAAYQPGPWMAVYYATKAYVLSFSEALSNELNGTGVTVSALCPGPTRTGFQERAGAKDIQLMKSKMMRVMDAATVAKIGYEGMMKNKRVIIPGFMNRIVATAARIGPRDWSTAIAGSLNKSKE
ncbi:SDR family oxidoreductase [bacterium]|nr:SDR family oxidoreductase [bacterium]MCI0603914.1 SDR family oxidoreductase [bacterium]